MRDITCIQCKKGLSIIFSNFYFCENKNCKRYGLLQLSEEQLNDIKKMIRAKK